MSLLPFLAAFALTFIVTPPVARFFFNRGVVGVDLHKEGKIKVSELGGASVFFSVIVVLTYHYFIGVGELLFPILALIVIGTLGIIDHYTRLTAVQKIASFYVIGVFLAWGLGYRGAAAYLVIGFLFMAAVNFTNMLAGFNGLEIGTGAIASTGIMVASYLAGESRSFIIASTMAGALLAFLYYNRFPASVFPGDVGTLIIGAALSSAILLGRLYVPGLLIFTPYIVDAVLKFTSAGVMTRETQKPTEVRGGKLYIPKDTNLSLARIFLRQKAMSEREVVRRVWAVEAFFAVLAVAYGVIF
ncbi:phospho-N-acetylmuramoyl-pentapeptide-transferase [archaeon BMS3Abin16]|nr:phospho-N-acetylmuramoyl-pentapeptide-transferase [archaeon BMS3Abin16]